MVCSICGEEYTAEKTCYNRTEANSWEAWMKNQEGTCPDCYKKKMQAEREEKLEAERIQHKKDNAEAALNATNRGLPELSGTPKQIAWANTIREKFLCSFRCKDGADEDVRIRFDMVINHVISNHATASSWIDNQNRFRSIMKEAQIEVANKNN